jgi:hypothetical protein
MSWRLLSYVFVVAVVALLGLATRDYFAPGFQPALRVEQTQIQVGSLISGQERTVVFHLENQSRRPIRVLGIALC